MNALPQNFLLLMFLNFQEKTNRRGSKDLNSQFSQIGQGRVASG